MSHFASVSAVRIHGWVKRTTELRSARGASAALKIATSRAAVEPHLPAGTRWCVQAGEISGVVAVEADDALAAEAAVLAIAAHLRSALPAVELESWWAESVDYVSAFDAWDAQTLSGARDPGVMRRLFLPPILDVPAVESCALCRDEAVDTSLAPVPSREKDEPPRRVGRDCGMRLEHSRPEATPALVPGRLAEDFETLAERGGVGGDGKRVDSPIRRSKTTNHLATISADGNAVGGLLQALATPGPGLSQSFSDQIGELRRRVPGVIQIAASESLRLASAAVSAQGQDVAPVAVHVEAGDDIVVSVPAPLAWRFVAKLLDTFDREVERELRDWAPPRLKARTAEDEAAREAILDKLAHLSLGAGLVFAHASHPFSDCLDTADSILREAKQATRGQTSAVSWADITEDIRARSGRHLAATSLVEQLEHPGRIPTAMRLTRSAQASLSQMLTDLWGGSDAQADIDEAHRAIRTWAKRTRSGNVLADTDPADHHTATESELAALRGHLSRARWWPAMEGMP